MAWEIRCWSPLGGALRGGHWDTSKTKMLFCTQQGFQETVGTTQQWVMLFLKLAYDFRENSENSATLRFPSACALGSSQTGSLLDAVLDVLPSAQAP